MQEEGERWHTLPEMTGRRDGPRGGQAGGLGPHDAVALRAQVGTRLRRLVSP